MKQKMLGFGNLGWVEIDVDSFGMVEQFCREVVSGTEDPCCDAKQLVVRTVSFLYPLRRDWSDCVTHDSLQLQCAEGSQVRYSGLVRHLNGVRG